MVSNKKQFVLLFAISLQIALSTIGTLFCFSLISRMWLHGCSLRWCRWKLGGRRVHQILRALSRPRHPDKPDHGQRPGFNKLPRWCDRGCLLLQSEPMLWPGRSLLHRLEGSSSGRHVYQLFQRMYRWNRESCHLCESWNEVSERQDRCQLGLLECVLYLVWH